MAYQVAKWLASLVVGALTAAVVLWLGGPTWAAFATAYLVFLGNRLGDLIRRRPGE